MKDPNNVSCSFAAVHLHLLLLFALFHLIIYAGFGATTEKQQIPVVLWHGVDDSCCNSMMMRFVELIRNNLQPNVYVKSIMLGGNEKMDLWMGWVANMNKQVDIVCSELKSDPMLANGFNAIGISQGGLFIDPIEVNKFKEKSIFLADINCEKHCDPIYKQNLLRLDNFVLVMFLRDEMVIPKESAWFGFYADNTLDMDNVIPMEQTALYSEDKIGYVSDEKGHRKCDEMPSQLQVDFAQLNIRGYKCECFSYTLKHEIIVERLAIWLCVSLSIINFIWRSKDVHPSWSLIRCALTFAILATVGIIFNFCVIFVTIRSKSLNGTTNYLLALYSFFELLHQLGHFLFAYTALSGQNFIEFRLAAKFLYVPILGMGALIPTIFFASVVRLIAIVFGEIHGKNKIRIYLAVITAICLLNGVILSLLVYQTLDFCGDQMIIGTFVDFFKDTTAMNVLNLIMIIMASIIYLFVGIVIRIKSAGLPSAQSINHRTFRALFCIIFVNISGYFITLAYLNLIGPSISSPITAWFGQAIVGIPLNIGSASNAPILYFTSTDYREAFQKEFPFVFKRILKANRTIPQMQQIVSVPPMRLVNIVK